MLGNVDEFGNRDEFVDAFIGWLGDKESFKQVLGLPDEEYEKLLADDDSEEFEETLCAKLATYSVDELNELCKTHHLPFVVTA